MLLISFGVPQAQVPNESTNLVDTPINKGGVIQFLTPSNLGGSAITNYEYSTDGGRGGGGHGGFFKWEYHRP